ncbi:Lipase [Trema orientale]|uniref:Lipase n=1 Tax=Trema orientale TaxID=63057 RepID=A0A2P5D6W4_TREOI|nr:Lipase [Trema orientale]
MEFSLLVSLIFILISTIFVPQLRALEYTQGLGSSTNPTILPSSVSVIPSIGTTIPQFPPPPLVPALFVIGDSSVDSGTNNFLGTLARADRPPYGRDFDTHRPTGRFSNGRIPVDYLALRLGLPFVPSYLGQSGSVEDMIHGVNYASAGAGIIFTSGSELGQRISFTQQIQQFTDTFQKFMLSMGEQAAADLISNSVFYISIGINDYIHYYLRNVSNVQTLYQPWTFNQFLASTVRQQLKNLYNLKARKMVIMGLPPIGCAPHYLWQYGSQNGECIEEINDMVVEFNFAMRYTIEELGRKLRNSSIIFCDVLEASMDILQNHDSYGFNVTTDACCGWGKYKGWIMCLSPEMACSNASNYIWWDQFHPTDAVNAIIAGNVWNGRHSKMCYPRNLEDMIV